MNNRVSVTCWTNLDGYQREKWPESLQCRPLVGDRIAAESKRNLRVVAVRHDYDGELSVELHK